MEELLCKRGTIFNVENRDVESRRRFPLLA
jgi:hypothetical protein